LKRLGLIFGFSEWMERVNVRGSNEGCDSASGAANVTGGILMYEFGAILCTLIF
jgi:hypothetical protein